MKFMENLLEKLKDYQKGFDRVIVNIKIIRKYRDQNLLNKYILEEKLAKMMEISLEERKKIYNEITTIKNEQNFQENLKNKQESATLRDSTS